MSNKEIIKRPWRKGDDASHLNWVYGINPVKEVLTYASNTVKGVYVLKGSKNKRLTEIAAIARRRNLLIKEVDAEFFNTFEGDVHQGVCVLVEGVRAITVAEVYERAVVSGKGRQPLFVILDEIEDPRNFGAILRVAECAAVSAVVYQSVRQAGMSDVVGKTSAGASALVTSCEVSNVKHAIRFLQGRGVFVYGAYEGGERVLWDVDLTVPVAFVFGSEASGMRRIIKEMCDELIHVPMYGKVESLNVSVACGVFLFECKRQREMAARYKKA
ncbi:MAG: 23S rRNA (guanosine(2251)-2'-O)-methyltransferase RlmB [Candidatus Magnetoovum sp. WYHC-5]|nr:23S rRNA (guanosine(2251)-2'-O)-methyltransferase RlmB [Candidatus Magnetoovum sp. WYHC-5]